MAEEFKLKAHSMKTVDDIIRFLNTAEAFKEIGLSERDQQRLRDRVARNVDDFAKSDARRDDDPTKVLDLMKGIMVASGYDVRSIDAARDVEFLLTVEKAVLVSDPAAMETAKSRISVGDIDRQQVSETFRKRTLKGKVQAVIEGARVKEVRYLGPASSSSRPKSPLHTRAGTSRPTLVQDLRI